MTYEEGQALTLRWLGEAGLAACARVLDVGCGPGNLARLVFEHIGAGGSLVGLDRDVAFLEQARAQHQGRDATFLHADLAGELPRDLGTLREGVSLLLSMQQNAISDDRVDSYRAWGTRWG